MAGGRVVGLLSISIEDAGLVWICAATVSWFLEGEQGGDGGNVRGPR